MIKALLNWLLKGAIFHIYTSAQPVGRLLGGHDVPGIPDLFLILHIEVAGQIVLLGYFQTS